MKNKISGASRSVNFSSKIQPGLIQLFSISRITNKVKFSLHKDINTHIFSDNCSP